MSSSAISARFHWKLVSKPAVPREIAIPWMSPAIQSPVALDRVDLKIVFTGCARHTMHLQKAWKQLSTKQQRPKRTTFLFEHTPTPLRIVCFLPRWVRYVAESSRDLTSVALRPLDEYDLAHVLSRQMVYWLRDSRLLRGH